MDKKEGMCMVALELPPWYACALLEKMKTSLFGQVESRSLFGNSDMEVITGQWKACTVPLSVKGPQEASW